ncbi:MAG: hypothetical protein ACI4F8_05225 [Lachnospiraceae bacterium]
MEITRIATVRLTSISAVKDESEILEKDEAKKRIIDAMTQKFNIDDVEILDVQDFIMDQEKGDEE